MSTEPTPGSKAQNPAEYPAEKTTEKSAENSAQHAVGQSPDVDASASADRPSAEAEAAAGAPRHHDDLIGDLRRELSDLRDKNLRLLADMENLRRRTEDEKASAAKYAITRFATDIITVGDNFQRATGAVPAGAADTDPALKSLLDGVQMIEREYLNVLDRHGVKRIAAKGEMFSPHLHQPMMQVPNTEVPAGTILQVFQDGYTIGDRLLRAAVVTVAEGGPKPGAKTGEAASEAVATGAVEAAPTAKSDHPAHEA